MLRSFKLTLILVFITAISVSALAQEKPLLKEVLLDGKLAILNVRTGKITLKDTTKIATNAKVVSEPEEAEKTVVTETTINTSEVTDSEEIQVSDFHIVKAGETMFALSKRYNTTLTDLKEANNLSTTLLKVGQKLVVKNFDSHKQTIKFSNNWTVSKGDTLYNIAKRTNTTVSNLKQLNNLETNTIFIGQVLRLK